MNTVAKKMIVLALIATFILAPFTGPAFAQERLEKDNISGPEMAADALLVRPLGFVSTILGSVLFVVSLPFSYFGGNYEEAAQQMVVEPAKFTFTRPLGDYSK